MKKYVLIAILLLAAFFRFAQIGSNPPSLTWDEVAWGYNAYSLGIDGKDEFGKHLPLTYFESFGDFKPPVYAYLDVLPVKVFGLTEFAVRFPSALFGTATVLMTYFLVTAIFFQEKNKKKQAKYYSENLALVSAFILAISPWHIMLSRGAFEANVSTFFLVVGVWSFLEAINRRKWFLILSAVSFVLAVYTFNTARIVGPLLVLGMTLIFWKQLWHMKKVVVTAAIVGFIVLLPTLSFLFSPQARLRFQEVNIFSDIKVIQVINQEVANDHDAAWSKVIHNRRLAYAVAYLNHYLDNLSPEFLFTRGDPNPKFSLQTMGQMYLFELPFLLIGIFFLFRKREGHWWIIPFWLLVGIIPAGAARETPHALRIETTLPTFQILVAYGLMQTFTAIRGTLWRVPLRKAFIVALSVIILFQMGYAIEEYVGHYPKVTADEWQYGYKETVAYINHVEKGYDQIYLTRELGRPYIYLLFYKQYNPNQFRKEVVIERDVFGFVNVQAFNKYIFDKKFIKNPARTLYIDIPRDVPKNAVIKDKIFTGPNSFIIYTLPV